MRTVKMFNLEAIKMCLRNLVLVDMFVEAAVVLLVLVGVDFGELILELYLDYYACRQLVSYGYVLKRRRKHSIFDEFLIYNERNVFHMYNEQ